MAEEKKDKDKEKLAPDIVSQVAERVDASDNVLVTLSKDPSVDELSAALGLTFILDKLGKHATAIFSGAVPNAIEFLEPEKTFETNTNSLQDFIIALNKDKADHLRYKIDGDFVKVFITPYKTTINESDLEFSHGDYNVDLVIALNVESSADLDNALTEYGRIMHDASSVNIHAGEPGGFADLEWGDTKASSVSEMICNLVDHLSIPKDKPIYDKSVATALLAGIVSATNRFSNEHTSAETMAIAGRLMAAGADQQLISSSIPVDILTGDVVDANAEAGTPDATSASAEVPTPEDPSTLNIQHGAVDFQPETTAPTTAPAPAEAPTPEVPVDAANAPLPPEAESQLNEIVAQPAPGDAAGPLMSELQNAVLNEGKKNLVPPSESGIVDEPPKDYASMMSAELAGISPDAPPAPETPAPVMSAPSVPAPETPTPEASAPEAPVPDVSAPVETPAPDVAASVAPDVPQNPMAPPVPEMPAAPEFAATEAPVPEAAPTPESMLATAELADNPLPMPDANTVLPPPPVPFEAGETAPATAYDTPVSSVPPTNSSSYVIEPQGVQAYPAAEAPAPAAPVMPPVDASLATPAITPAGDAAAAAADANSTYLGTNPAMPDQLYPDPNAYHIPGT